MFCIMYAFKIKNNYIGGILMENNLKKGVTGKYTQNGTPIGYTVCYSLAIYVNDADQVFEKAVEKGAKVREPISNFVSGDRYGSILDPFGVRWSIMSRIDDLSEEESNRRVAEWANSFSSNK